MKAALFYCLQSQTEPVGATFEGKGSPFGGGLGEVRRETKRKRWVADDESQSERTSGSGGSGSEK